jgi:hypothetical protein
MAPTVTTTTIMSTTAMCTGRTATMATTITHLWRNSRAVVRRSVATILVRVDPARSTRNVVLNNVDDQAAPTSTSDAFGFAFTG